MTDSSGRGSSAGCRVGARLSRGGRQQVTFYLAAPTCLTPTIAGSEPVETGSALATSGGIVALAVASGKRVFISRRKPSSVSTLAAILAIWPNSELLEAAGLLAVSNAERSASPLI